MTEEFVVAFEAWPGKLLDFMQLYQPEMLAEELGIPLEDATAFRNGKYTQQMPLTTALIRAQEKVRQQVKKNSDRVGNAFAHKPFRKELVAAIRKEGPLKYADRILDSEIGRVTTWLKQHGDV